MASTASAVPGEHRLHRAVEAVAYPAGETTRQRLPLDPGAIADALYQPGDGKVDGAHAHRRTCRSGRLAYDRGRRALLRAVEHRLDVVAVGVEHEGGVVAGVVGALAGRAVVRAAGGQRRLVEAQPPWPCRAAWKARWTLLGVPPGSVASMNSSSAWKKWSFERPTGQPESTSSTAV